MDDYYKDMGGKGEEFYRNYDFDRPEAIDHKRLVADLDSLLCGGAVEAIKYDFRSHSRQDSDFVLGPYSDALLLVEGIFAFSFFSLLSLADLKVFISIGEEEMLSRRMKRDCEERGRSPEFVREQFMKFVLPSHRRYLLPQESKADLVVCGSDSVEKNVDLISKWVRRLWL
jgi:uridine kinase